MDIQLKLEELRALRDAHKNKIRVAKSNMDPGFYQRSKDYLLDQIKTFQKQLEELENGFENGQSIIEASQDRIVALNKQINQLENLQTIERYKQLQKEIAALNGEVVKCEKCGAIATTVLDMIALCEKCSQ